MGDYIDRDALIYSLQKIAPDEYNVTVNNVIMGMPKVDVAKVVHGQFVKTKRQTRDGRSEVYGWECTVCKRFTRSPFIDSWKFCPNCGAEMSEFYEPEN